jgi:Xaa-Pro aminopeptidase
MICSNEPGYYEDGGFGIRVENLLVIKEADTEFRCACAVVCAILLATLQQTAAACVCVWNLLVIKEADTEFRCVCCAGS